MQIESETGVAGVRNPLTYLVEAADDLVYSIVDIEDAITKHVFADWDDLSSKLRDDCPDDSIRDSIHSIDHKLTHSAFYNKLNTDQRSRTASQLLRTELIGKGIPAMAKAFADNYDDIMNGTFTDDLLSKSSIRPILETCKQFGQSYVYRTPSTVKLEISGRKVIHDLLDLFWEACASYDGKPPTGVFPSRIWALLSDSYKMVFEEEYHKAKSEYAKRYAQLQLMTDYICGMTDNFACNLHRELLGGS